MRCRMFVSHPLTTKALLGSILDDRRVAHLENMKKELKSDPDSAMLIMLLLSVIKRTVEPTNIPPCADQSKRERPRPPEDKSLIWKAQSQLERLSTQGTWFQRYQLQRCPGCQCDPDKFYLVSCGHRFCESCFDKLPDQQGNVESRERQCSSCKLDIKSVVYCTQSFPSALSPVEDLLTEASPNKKRANATSKKSGKEPPARKKRCAERHTDNIRSQFLSTMQQHPDQSEDNENDASGNYIEFEPEPEPEPDLDWIKKIGPWTPGAKQKETKKLIQQWLEEDKEAKIVVFVEFIGTMELLQYMCKENGWAYGKINGKTSLDSREAEIQKFRTKANVKILLVTMRTCGLGINLAMANKCIIYDRWWNEATEYQAYCRLHRIGQQREVEVVKLVAEGTIDNWMVELQEKKTTEINEYMNDKEIIQLMKKKVRLDPESTISLLNSHSNFGAFTQQPGGGLRIKGKGNAEGPGRSSPHGDME
ncbi:unnamed protein product [Penicillium bialowiezense]